MKKLLKNKTFLFVLTAIWLGITLFFVWLTSHNIPFMMDDLWYSTRLDSEQPIGSVRDIVHAQIWHYNNWGGRVMAHTMLQFVLWAGKPFSEIFKTIMVLLTGIIITFVTETITGKKMNAIGRMLSIIFVIGGIHGLNYEWKLSMYWESGAANYLYITVFIMLFLWCYIRDIAYIENSAKNNSIDGHIKKLPLIELWIIPLAIFAGCSNENMGAVAFLFATATIIYVYKKTKKIKPWMIIGAVVCLVAFVICVKAPGNDVRSATIPMLTYSFKWQAYLRTYYLFKGGFMYLMIPFIPTAFLVITIKGVLKQKLGVNVIFLLVAALLSWGAMILSPHYPDRAAYGTMVLLIMACTSMGKQVLETEPKSRWYMYGFGVVVWLRAMYFLNEYLGLAWGWIV